MPEYWVQDSGRLRQIHPRPQKPHAGSVLSEDEWHEAIDDSRRRLTSMPAASVSQEDQPTHILQHLVRMAKVDKQYAWWSAHLQAALQPELADMPQRLADAVNQQDVNSQQETIT